MTKAEANPSVDVGDTLDTSEITVFRRNLKGDTLHNSVNAEACGSRGNSVTQDFLTVSSLESNAVRSLRKLQKVRSNSLGQEPSEGLTMKCNTLMTKGVGGKILLRENRR